MRISTLCIAVAMAFATAVSAAELSYNARSVTTSRTIDYMDITATEGGSTIWEMTIVTNVSDGHTYWMEGDIVNFVDSQHGGGFDYGPDAAHIANRGIFVGGKVDILKNFAAAVVATDPDKFVMTLTGTDQNFDVVQTITINAPAVAGGGYTSTVDFVTVATNNTAGTLNNSAFNATNEAGINLVGDGNNYTFDNPLNGKVKGDPNTINHPYYDLVSWFGSGDTLGDAGDGTLAQATVSAGAPATMRQGLQFKYEDDRDLTYTDLANDLRGAVAQAGTYGGVLRLQVGNGLREPTGRTPSRDFAAGTSFTITGVGTITAPVPEPATFGLLALGGVLIAARRR